MPVIFSLNVMKSGPRPHFENPSANPHTLLTVSGIRVLNLMLIEAAIHDVFSKVADTKMTEGREISAG